MKTKLFVISIILVVFVITACNRPQKDYLNESAAEKKERMAWWDEAKFGMFIHWGLYSIPAGEYMGTRTPSKNAEWIMHHLQIPISEYEKYALQFNPTKYNADEWVSIAKNAGMKYIVLTSKHHDGFCLWNSKYTRYDVMDATPFKRDIIKELSEACKREGIRLCFYHSIMDWHHPDAQAINEPNYNHRDKDKVNPNFPRYVEKYLKPQLKELMTKYGDISVMWFDGEWIPDYTTEMAKDIYNYLRNIKPDLIINNRIDKGRQGMKGMDTEGKFAGDFGTPEQEIPATGVPGLKWESCMTMNDSWGYKYFDENWKSAETLIRNLIDIVSKGGNFLLNVGPTAEGLIPDASIERLQVMGNWMKVNSESIYGADPSPFEKPAWGRYSTKGNRIYAFIFDWPEEGTLIIPEIKTVNKAWLLADPNNSALPLTSSETGISIQLPTDAPDKIATVVVLEK